MNYITSITELLTNDEQIDENDEDFQHILNLLSKQYKCHEESQNKAFKQPITKPVDIEKPHHSVTSYTLDDTKAFDIKTIESATECKSIDSTPLNVTSIDTRPFHQSYPDFANVSLADLPNNIRKNTNTRGGLEIFPVKLFKILERSYDGGYASVISWLSHGRAFKVHNEDLFLKNIMKKYFFQTEFKSFKNQLYVYGFKKIGKRFPDSGAYYHELFIRGRLDLCNAITKLNGSVSPFSMTPNFYSMPRVPNEHDQQSGSNEAGSNVDDELREIQYKTNV